MTTETPSPTDQPPAGKALLKLFLELGPLVLYFVLNSSGRTEGETSDETLARVVYATKGFVIAILVALPLAWCLERKVPWMSVFTAVLVGSFGGLTILLEDKVFIQLKPTVASLIFAALLFGGLLRGKLFLKSLFGMSMPMDEDGWRKLTIRWALFFLFMASCNEVVRLTQSWDTWMVFKVWGLLPMTFVFTMSQMGLMKRHELVPEGSTPPQE